MFVRVFVAIILTIRTVQDVIWRRGCNAIGVGARIPISQRSYFFI
jgi:hypothetical protein